MLNIAYDVSPLLQSSGLKGDRSGVHRISLGLISAIAAELENSNDGSQIYLFTVNPELTWILDQHPDIAFLIESYSCVHILPITASRLPEAFLDDRFHEPGYNSILWKKFRKFTDRFYVKQWISKYIQQLEQTLLNHKVSLIHHSETGFFKSAVAKNVITINDLVTWKFPFLCQAETRRIHASKLYFARKHADGVISISENTKRDFIAYCDSFHDLRSSEVIYPGVSEQTNCKSFSELNQLISKSGKGSLLEHSYFIHVGTFEPRKNIVTLINAFIHAKLDSRFRLVLVGGNGWASVQSSIDDYCKREFPDQESSPIVILPFLSDAYITTLIKNAQALVYPTLYEGFGLPIVEALLLGTAVLAPSHSSIPEVIPTSCVSQLESLPVLINSLKKSVISTEEFKKDAEFVSKFSWEKSAKQTLQYYKNLTGLSV